MSSHAARRARRGAVVATAGLTAAALLLGGVATSGNATPDRTAATSVDTTYLQDALGLPAESVVEPVTYDRFQWLLQQPGQFAFVVGSPSDGFKTRIQQVDLAAKAANVARVYWFDPNLSGYTGAKNLDIRNPGGITSIGAASQTIYGNTWNNVVAQYLGNGLKATGAGTGTITTTADDTVVNDAVAPLWDHRTSPAAAPVAASDDVFFLYDKDHTSDGKADKVRGGVNLTTDANAATTVAASFAAIGGATLDRLDQFQWWKAENNRRLAAQGDAAVFGQAVLQDADAARGWNVKQLTYPELLHLLEVKDSAEKNFVLLLGGTWCPNTRAVIKNVNEQAVANDVTVYNFDTVLDGGVVGGGTTSANNPIQIRNNAVNGSTNNYAPSHLYGDLVRKYLRNIVTEYDPNTGTRVLYYPDGDTTKTPDVVRRLQVPFLVNYQRGTGANPSTTSIKRQWIQQRTDASTGLPTFKEYMSQFWFTNPAGTRLGLSPTDLPLELAVPADPATAPDRAFLTAAEAADPSTTGEQKATLVTQRRSKVTTARANEEFGQDAMAKLRTFFAGLPGAVVSTQTVTAAKVAYGTAPKVRLAIANPYGRIPGGDAKLVVAGKQYTTKVAQNAASFTLPKLSPGAYKYTLSYATDAEIVGFSRTGTLTVTKAKVGKLRGAVAKTPTSKRAGSYKVTVTTGKDLSKATGKVTVTIAKGKTTKRYTATLRSGAATVSLPKLAKGTWKVTVRYAGDARYVSGTTAGASTIVKK